MASSFRGPLEESRCTVVSSSVHDKVNNPSLTRPAKITRPSRSRAADDTIRKNHALLLCVAVFVLVSSVQVGVERPNHGPESESGL